MASRWAQNGEGEGLQTNFEIQQTDPDNSVQLPYCYQAQQLRYLRSRIPTTHKDNVFSKQFFGFSEKHNWLFGQIRFWKITPQLNTFSVIIGRENCGRKRSNSTYFSIKREALEAHKPLKSSKNLQKFSFDFIETDLEGYVTEILRIFFSQK